MTPFCLLRLLLLGIISLPLLGHAGQALEPIPDRLVVLTFDDSVASHHSVVRPILKRFGFGATFFITEGFSFRTNKLDYMTWEQIADLHRDGFEIGNHTRDHLGISPDTLGRLREQIEAINQRCADHGIPRTITFAYPGNRIEPGAIPILQQLGIRFARRGGAPEHPYEWGRGFAYEPGRDHPLLIPSAGDARPDWTLEDFKRAAEQARDGRIAVLQFHGVPDREHPWVHTEPERFEQFMRYLHDQKFTVIAMRDLSRYVDAGRARGDPLAVIEERQRQRKEVLVEGQILDAGTGRTLPARLYIRSADGAWHFAKAAFHPGSSVKYERRNSANTNAVEFHTTLSAHPFRIELRPGRYELRVEHGKEYFPELREIEVAPGMAKLEIKLRRWVNMAELGWFSGDAHNHRQPADLPNVMLAEDLNVALPMVDWTTVSTVSPAASAQSFRGKFSDAPVAVDATHVWYARNTEYEIFRVESSNHTLGAFLILNHRSRFDVPVFPLSRVAEQARREGALIDLEKHNWPWSMALVPLLNVDLFELANNHHWQTEFAIRNWAIPAPAWMKLSGSGTDSERDWTLYGFQAYYALLNCGFKLRPSAGTANGVHPVPLGFSRVYVRLDEPFSYDAWMRGLAAGRTFVTTGPMLFGTVNQRHAGVQFKAAEMSGGLSAHCTLWSEQPLESIEMIVNGEVAKVFPPENRRHTTGRYETEVTAVLEPARSGWLAFRCFELRERGRFRFAHSAPWHFEVPGKPLSPTRAQAEWLVANVRAEIERSRRVAPPELIADYEKALAVYRDLLDRAE
jgi:peptidoglycan/xylan/chitin deacetylase (PgdA/CDA1 family)